MTHQRKGVRLRAVAAAFWAARRELQVLAGMVAVVAGVATWSPAAAVIVAGIAAAADGLVKRRANE